MSEQLDEIWNDAARTHDEPRCLQHNPNDDDCKGEVNYHWNGDPGGSTFPRCDRHQQLREASRENSIEKYANSDIAPSWFDPSAAGERWDDDY